MSLQSLRFHLTPKSANSKTGPIPVTTSSKATCPSSCPFLGSGCYAESGPLAIHGREVSGGRRGDPLPDFLEKVRALPDGQLWRHNQTGDLVANQGKLSRTFMRGIVAANANKRGFTYTHHKIDLGENLKLLRYANRSGFTVNISTETEAAADHAISQGLPAVLTVASSEARNAWRTPAGNQVLVCPAQRSATRTCSTCALCHKRGSRVIIAFRAHGTAKRKAEQAIASLMIT